MSDLVKGLYFKVKHEKAPDFVLGNLSVKKADLIEFLNTQNEDWINMQILMSKGGKPYIAVDNWKPANKEQEDAVMGDEEEKKRAALDNMPDDDLPF